MNNRKKSRIRFILVLLVLLAIAAGLIYWYKFYRDVPQPAWITADQRDNFLYGSIGGESNAGMPYWVWLVLLRRPYRKSAAIPTASGAVL